jgi:molybdate transport system ATP-binding protein
MRVRLAEGPCEIEVPLGHTNAGNRIRVAIRAGDILLATQRPAGLSARNILQGKIVSIENRSAMAVAQVDCGAVFTVHITSGAVRELELGVGKTVWLVLKTHSTHFLAQ